MDKSIFFFFQGLQGGGLDALVLRSTALGLPSVALAVTGLLILFFDKKRPFEKIGIFSLGVMLAQHVEDYSKVYFHRPRPHLFWENVHVIGPLPHTYSFPSGHVTIAFAAAFLLTILYPRKGAWAFLPAAWIAFTRLYMGVHYPTDILGGILAGVGTTAVFWFFIARKFKSV